MHSFNTFHKSIERLNLKKGSSEKHTTLHLYIIHHQVYFYYKNRSFHDYDDYTHLHRNRYNKLSFCSHIFDLSGIIILVWFIYNDNIIYVRGEGVLVAVPEIQTNLFLRNYFSPCLHFCPLAISLASSLPYQGEF